MKIFLLLIFISFVIFCGCNPWCIFGGNDYDGDLVIRSITYPPVITRGCSFTAEVFARNLEQEDECGNVMNPAPCTIEFKVLKVNNSIPSSQWQVVYMETDTDVRNVFISRDDRFAFYGVRINEPGNFILQAEINRGRQAKERNYNNNILQSPIVTVN